MRGWPDDLLRVAAYLIVEFYILFAILHVYWALGGRKGLSAALPKQGGKPVFKPTRHATLAVAVCLAACSALLLSWLGTIPLAMPALYLRIGLVLMATTMLLRAIGDFRYVGIFKRRGEGRFYSMDTWIYTPLCIAISTVLYLLASVG